ncbi:MAG: hypothetical protein LBC60_03680 [Spirochaetaceae bacterium]|jgi:hypothetical protein|nr:hypothetical protein [Spirochaetaceae bacterium]
MEIKRTPYGPLRLGLLLYDFFRLLFMLELLITVIPLGESPEASWFPYLVYAVPNALFPLMGFFLLIRPEEYRAYISLYLAGKIIVVVSVFGWTLFSVGRMLGSVVPAPEFSKILGFVSGFFILDAASILGSSFLKSKLYRKAIPEPGETAPPAAPGDTVSEERGVS